MSANLSRSLVAVALAATATTAAADPGAATQACLGDLKTFLTCPAGARVSGTECRAREPRRGQGAGEHWSGSKRQGPALFLRDDDVTDPKLARVSFAAYYVDHKKTGRVFHFAPDGTLESWSDMAGDDYHGLSVTCLPDGRVSYLAYYDHDQVVGVSRSWRTSDGAFASAIDHGKGDRSDILAKTPALAARPDALCRPARCDVRAAPDLSGIPR